MLRRGQLSEALLMTLICEQICYKSVKPLVMVGRFSRWTAVTLTGWSRGTRLLSAPGKGHLRVAELTESSLLPQLGVGGVSVLKAFCFGFLATSPAWGLLSGSEPWWQLVASCLSGRAPDVGTATHTHDTWPHTRRHVLIQENIPL